MSYLDDIESQAAKLPYGELSISIKRFNNRSTGIIVHSYESQKFDNTADAAAAILQLIKDAESHNMSGSLTFTVILKSGKVSRVVKQGYDTIDYTKKSS